MITLKKLLLLCLNGLLVTLPFHTPLTVWMSSLFGHTYVWAAWKELVVLGLTVMLLVLLRTDEKLRRQLWSQAYNKVAFVYILLCGFYALIQRLSSDALVGLAINTRFVILLVIAQAAGYCFIKAPDRLQRIVVVTSGAVAILAIIQALLLPANFLTHIGYDSPGINTPGIPPASHKVAAESGLYRAQSSLRGPNVLGAYLLIPMILLVVATKSKFDSSRSALLAILLGALILSFSRSALLGLVGVLGLWVLWFKRTQLQSLASRYVYAGIIGFIGAAIAAIFVWNHPAFQTVVLHHNPDVVAVQSNQGHVELTLLAIENVAINPLGDGLGSAGPASALTDQSSARIAENYYLQVGQETGWLGMGLFIVLQILVAWALWQRRQQPFAAAALLILIALSFTNLLLHTWTDEVVALTAWAMFGVALSMRPQTARSKPTA